MHCLRELEYQSILFIYSYSPQVLHVSSKSDERAFLYVTDYTPRDDLIAVPPTASWTDDVADDRIIKIVVKDTPAKTANTLAPGDFVAIRSLRLKPFAAGKEVSAQLGGDEQLIFKLDPAESGNGNLLELLR